MVKGGTLGTEATQNHKMLRPLLTPLLKTMAPSGGAGVTSPEERFPREGGQDIIPSHRSKDQRTSPEDPVSQVQPGDDRSTWPSLPAGPVCWTVNGVQTDLVKSQGQGLVCCRGHSLSLVEIAKAEQGKGAEEGRLLQEKS